MDENQPVAPSSPAPSGGSRRSSTRSRREPKYTQVASGAEARAYDFVAARPPHRKTTIFESSAHLVKSCLGGGVVSIHEAYMAVGLWTALVLNVLLGLLVSYCMFLLAHAAQLVYGRCHVPSMSYPDLAECALDIGPFKSLRKFSRCFRYAVDATIMIDLFGSCCCYQVIISRTIKQLVEHVDDVTNEGNPHIRVYIIALLIPCILICMIRTLKYLAPFSIVADVFIVIICICTIVYGTMSAPTSPLEYRAFKSMEGLISFIGVCVFSMEGVGVTLAVENSMKDPRKVKIVILLGMSVVVAIVMLVGFFGYWGFGEKSKAPVTLNFHFSILTLILKIGMAFMIFVTFALNFWVPFELLWYYISKRYNPEKYWISERIYRAIAVTVITLISVVFPDVSKLMGVLGAFCLSNMGFIFPAFIEICLIHDDPGYGIAKWRLIKNILIILFGFFLMIYGTYSNVRDLIETVFLKK